LPIVDVGRAVEAIENMREILCGNADALIGHREMRCMVLAPDPGRDIAPL
jgi:hypothetical protein